MSFQSAIHAPRPATAAPPATGVGTLRWPRAARWWILVALALAAHVGLILWLGDRSPIRPRPAAPTSTLQLTPAAARQMLALTDPTLFALPHREGFSGPAWLTFLPQRVQPFLWTEPPCWLSPESQQLGTIELAAARESVDSESTPVVAPPEPALYLPIEEKSNPFPEHSKLRVTGELARRRLLTPLEPPPWPHSDLLTDTVVQLVVGPDGIPVSTPTLLARSGNPEADRYALEKSGTARFEALEPSDAVTATNPVARLMWGQFVFAWHTLPLPATNKPAAPGL